jgi:hypothetical protein
LALHRPLLLLLLRLALPLPPLLPLLLVVRVLPPATTA